MKLQTTRRVTTLVLAAFWTWFVIIAFFGSLPDSPMRLSKKRHLGLMAVLPEGWSFFTRSPREEDFAAYSRTSGGWQLINFRATSARSAFGISRLSRVQGVEFGGITAQVPEKAWTAHRDPFAPAAELDSIPLIKVDNFAVRKTACGEVLLEKKRPVPWAWGRSGQPVKMPAVYVRLAIDCDVPPPPNDPDASLMQAIMPPAHVDTSPSPLQPEHVDERSGQQ